MVKLLRKLSDKGASLTEYALLVSLIAVICLVAVAATGGGVRDLFNNTALTTSNLNVYGVYNTPTGSPINVSFNTGDNLAAGPLATVELARTKEIQIVAECKGDGGGYGKKTDSVVVDTTQTTTIPVDVNDGSQTYECTVNGIASGESSNGSLGGASAGNTISFTDVTLTTTINSITATFTATPAATNGYTLSCAGVSIVPPVTGISSPITIEGLTAGETYDCSVAAVSPDGGTSGLPISVTLPVPAPEGDLAVFRSVSYATVNSQASSINYWYSYTSQSTITSQIRSVPEYAALLDSGDWNLEIVNGTYVSSKSAYTRWAIITSPSAPDYKIAYRPPSSYPMQCFDVDGNGIIDMVGVLTVGSRTECYNGADANHWGTP